jgi:hypothetical protein
MNTTNTKPDDLKVLASLINALPVQYKAPMTPVLARIVEGGERRSRILSLVQSALGQLRLDTKYLAFDLEATRRERDAYKEKLEAK